MYADGLELDASLSRVPAGSVARKLISSIVAGRRVKSAREPSVPKDGSRRGAREGKESLLTLRLEMPGPVRPWKMKARVAAGLMSVGALTVAAQQNGGRGVEMRAYLHVDVDGAPNAYGPPGRPALDYETHAHVGSKLSGKVVGYLTQRDHRTPIIQGPNDPSPGYYISTTGFYDRAVDDERNPRRYVDAGKINYLVLGDFGRRHHVKLGDFAAVYSSRTRKSVYAIVGDEGNPSGCEGSLALVRALGYDIKDGKDDSVDDKEITIRYFPGSNPKHMFFNSQAKLDAAAKALHLSKQFE
jgi:hypothetical protein